MKLCLGVFQAIVVSFCNCHIDELRKHIGFVKFLVRGLQNQKKKRTGRRRDAATVDNITLVSSIAPLRRLDSCPRVIGSTRDGS